MSPNRHIRRIVGTGVVTLALVVAATAPGVVAPPGAQAVGTPIAFDDLAPGTRVATEYQSTSGVTFPPAGGWLQPLVKASAQAHSAGNLAVYSCEGLPGCGEGFPTPTIRAVLSASATSVSAYVGYYSAVPTADTVQVRLRAYDADGIVQAESPFIAVTAGDPLTQQATATAAAATIDYVEIVADAPGDNAGGKSIAFDDLAVTGAMGGAPNFTLNPGEGVVEVLQGASASVAVDLNRINDSSGDIAFAATGLPTGVTAVFSPNPVSGTATATAMTLVATQDAPATDAYSEVTVTATPSAGAGPTPRSTTKSVRVRTHYTLAAGSSVVDLAPCVVRVPVTLVRDARFAGPVSLSVDAAANGVGAAFDPGVATFPSGARSQTVDLVVTGPSTGQPVPATTVTIHGTVPGLVDRTASVTVQGTCPANYDARVTSLEITQGTQSQTLPQRDPAFPASPVAYADIPQAARLTRTAPTVVRVYANLQFGPSEGAPNVPALLYGSYRNEIGQLKALPWSPLSPITPPRTLEVGPDTPTAAEIGSETEAYTFVLPPEWIRQQAITVTARLLPSLGGGPRTVTPCDTAPCRDNDAFGLSGIPFVAARTVTVEPLQLTVSGTPLPDPQSVFAWLRMTLPVPLTIKPYQTTIDITDIKQELDDCRAATTAGTPERRACGNDANSAAAGRVSDWDCDNEPSDRTYVVGVNTGVARGLTRSHWCVGDFHMEHDAVVENARPLTSVAHEFGHLLGRVHADLLCGGNSDGQVGEAWPPDDQGFLQSNGLATDVGTGTAGGPYRVMAPPKQYYDYMSYCPSPAVEADTPPTSGDAWISVRNWNRIVDSLEYRRLPTDADRHLAAATAAGADAGATTGGVTGAMPVDGGSDRSAVASLHVSGWAADGGAGITSVEPVMSAAQPASESGYHLVGFDEAGRPVADVAMLEADVHVDGEPPARSLDAVIPASGVSSVAITSSGGTLASRSRSGNAPTVTVRGTPAYRGGIATLRWRAADRDDDALLVTVEYSADGGRSYRQVFTGPDRGVARIPARTLTRSSRARIRVTVNDGFRQATARSRAFRSPGAGPEVHILGQGLRQPSDAPLVLSGQASDDRGDALVGRSLRWKLGSRLLGTGARLAVTDLPAGRQRIDLVATDRFGRTSRDTVTVAVIAARPLFLTLTAPTSLAPKARSVRLRVASSLVASLVVRSGVAGAQRFRIGRDERAVTLRVPSGPATVHLRLTLRTGGKATTRTVSIPRAG